LGWTFFATTTTVFTIVLQVYADFSTSILSCCAVGDAFAYFADLCRVALGSASSTVCFVCLEVYTSSFAKVISFWTGTLAIDAPLCTFASLVAFSTVVLITFQVDTSVSTAVWLFGVTRDHTFTGFADLAVRTGSSTLSTMEQIFL